MPFSRRRTRVGPARLAVVTILTFGLLASACGPPRRSVTGWVPYWTTDTGRTTIDTAADLLSEISPFWYRATGATSLANDEPASDQAAVVAQAKAANIPLLPSVRDGMAARAMAAVLADPAQRAAHIATLVNLVEANGFAGIDLDYEQFAFADGTSSWATTRPVWVQFVAELGGALHARARLLSVTTPPIYNGTRAAGSGYWVYDWAAIAPHVDRLRIMAYDFSFSSPGPIAPLGWVRQIVSYAVTVVPPAKIQIGAPTYGRDWVVGVTGTCPNGVSPARADVRNSRTAALVQEKGAVPVRDGPSGEMTFSYVDTFTGPPPPATTIPGATTAPPPAQVTCQVTHTVWYPDIESIMGKARLVGEFGISGLAQWALGFEDPAQWQPVRDYAATLPHPGGTDPTGAVEVVQPGTGMLIVGGWAFDPETDLPVQVAVTTAGGRTVVLANGARADIAQAYPGAGPFHGFGYPIPAPPGRQTVCLEALGVGAGARATRIGCATVTVT
jgi:spore germination protein YaaH